MKYLILLVFVLVGCQPEVEIQPQINLQLPSLPHVQPRPKPHNKILAFEQPRCVPCKQMHAHWTAMGADRINIVQHPIMAQKYGITSTPTTVLLDAEGNEIGRHVGVF